MHNDEPTLVDVLNRESLVFDVGKAVARCTPPQVFGIHGDWGLGKTSFLHQLQFYLTGVCPQQSEEMISNSITRGFTSGRFKRTVRGVWFDAWQHQYEHTPIVALLQEMRSQLSWSQQTGRIVKRNTEIAVRGALLSIEELTKQIGFQYSKFRDENREWESRNFATPLPSHTLRQHLRKAIGQLIPKKSHDNLTPRLAVFIDDIDRCDPDVAYRLLEGLKIYLTLDNCVFILGMNQKAVEDAIASRLGVLSDNTTEEANSQSTHLRARAASYMEKLCQNVWQLPTIRDTGLVLQGLLEKTVDSEVARGWIARVINESPCLPPNPRRLKGLANLIGRLASRLPNELGADDQNGIFESKLLLVVAYIYQFHSDIYVRWEAEVEFYNRILDKCRGDGADVPILDALVLPIKSVDTGQEPTPTPVRESTYPDPTEHNVFWIQPLVLHLGSEVTPEQFRTYLHGSAA